MKSTGECWSQVNTRVWDVPQNKLGLLKYIFIQIVWFLVDFISITYVAAHSQAQWRHHSGETETDCLDSPRGRRSGNESLLLQVRGAIGDGEDGTREPGQYVLHEQRAAGVIHDVWVSAWNMIKLWIRVVASKFSVPGGFWRKTLCIWLICTKWQN